VWGELLEATISHRGRPLRSGAARAGIACSQDGATEEDPEMRFQGWFARGERYLATTISSPAARLLDHAVHATTLSRWILVMTSIGAGLACLALASYVHGVAAPITPTPSTPAVATIVPASGRGAHAAAAPSGVRQPSSGIPDTRLRLGFLEFENDPDAPAN
jgi:hypothetical protein